MKQTLNGGRISHNPDGGVRQRRLSRAFFDRTTAATGITLYTLLIVNYIGGAADEASSCEILAKAAS
jgi:hypothetical protein